MRPQTPLDHFLLSDFETRRDLLQDTKTIAQVKEWMGSEAFAQFMSLDVDSQHLGVGPKNIIFAPGIMGSTLQSMGVGGVWWLDIVRARDKLNHLRLNDGGQGDQDEDADIKPGAVDISYEPFCRAIARSRKFGGCVNFSYDWRMSLRNSVETMRIAILKTHQDYGKPVHLVGHSMGGLLIRTTLMVHGEELWPKIGRIVYIGTPHYGSPSIAGYLKNHLWGWEELAVIGWYLSRETFRSLRGALSLLPAPTGVYPGTRNGEQHPCANFDLYVAEEWKLGLNAAETVHLQAILDDVKQYYRDLSKWHDGLLQVYKDRMLVIAGVGQRGLFRLDFDRLLGIWDRATTTADRKPCDLHYDGDGRVPLASAKLEDVAIRFVKGEHGALPNIPAVAQDVISWLMDDKLRLSTTCKDALGGHLSAGDQTSSAPLLDGTTARDRLRVLPEYENPTPEFRAAIEKKIDSGAWPQINLVKLL
jgi:pimeloyl-ACP methyl ester carboxylesterase